MPDETRPVLLCLDLEAGSEELASRAGGYARRLASPLHVLYVLPQSSRETEEAAAGRLKELVESALEGADVRAVAVRRGRAEDRIVDYVTEKAVEMVVLGHRHRARRERVYVGSTTRSVISLAPGPVLVIPIDHEG